MNDTGNQTRRNMWMFPLGTVGRDMIYQLFTNFIYTYVLFTRTLTPAQLTAITVIMIASRVFDALNDPIMGNIIERTRTRWGKYKPWQVIGILSTSVVVYLAFNITLQGWPFVIFFGFIYFGYSITYTMHDISYWGMVPSLSKNSSDRDRFTSMATLCAGIGGTLAGIIIPMFTTGSSAIGGSAQSGYGMVALMICILSPAFMCFTIFGAREDRSYMTEQVPPVSFKKIWSTVTGNDQLLWIALIFLLQQMGNDLVLGGIGATYIYFAFGYEGGLYSLFSTVGVSATALLMIFYPMIAARIRRKKLMDIMMAAAAVGYVLMALVGLFMPNNMAKFWMITILYMITALGQYAFYLVMMISIINTVEYNEYKTGSRDEAIISSLRPFLTKLASALVVAITTAGYLLCGVTGITNQISVLEQQASQGLIDAQAKAESISAALQSASSAQTAGLLLLMAILPGLLMAASWILYRRHYRLDETEYNRIVSELQTRAQSK